MTKLCVLKNCHSIAANNEELCGRHVRESYLESLLKETDSDIKPSHYNDIFPVDCFTLIKARMKACYGEEWKKYYEGFLIGNEFKYRDRAGFKGDAQLDIQKAVNYNRIRKELCSEKPKEL